MKSSIYIESSLNGLGLTIYTNLIQYIAILLGSVGIIQGLMTSVQQLGGALLNPVWGRLSDFFGRRRFLFIGNILLATITIITPFSPSAIVILILLTAETIAVTIVNPAWNGFLGDVTAVAKRGFMLGRIGFITTIFGNILLLFITFYMNGADPTASSINVFQIPFIVSGCAFLGAAIIAIFLPTNLERKRPKSVFPAIKLSDLHFPPAYKRLLLADTLFTFAWASTWPIFPYITLDIANNWLVIGLIAFVSALFTAISQGFGGILADKFGSKKVIIGTRFIIIFIPLLYAIANITGSIYVLYLMNIIVGLSLGAAGISITLLILD